MKLGIVFALCNATNYVRWIMVGNLYSSDKSIQRQSVGTAPVNDDCLNPDYNLTRAMFITLSSKTRCYDHRAI